MVHGNGYRILQTLPVTVFNLQFIDHDLYTVVFITINSQTVSHLRYGTIDPYFKKSFPDNLFKELFIVSFAVFYYGCKDYGFLIIKFFKYKLYDLFVTIPDHFFTGNIGIGY